MGWVTLDDGQHVFIGAGGKVLALRGAISSAGGAKERGKSLAARSKAAIGKARAIQHAKTEAGAHPKMQLSSKGPPKRQGLRSAFPGGSQYLDKRMKAPVMVEALMKKQKWTDKDVARVHKWAPLLDHDRDRARRAARLGLPKTTAGSSNRWRRDGRRTIWLQPRNTCRSTLNPPPPAPFEHAKKGVDQILADVKAYQDRAKTAKPSLSDGHPAGWNKPNAKAAGPTLREQVEKARAGKGLTEHQRHREAQEAGCRASHRCGWTQAGQGRERQATKVRDRCEATEDRKRGAIEGRGSALVESTRDQTKGTSRPCSRVQGEKCQDDLERTGPVQGTQVRMDVQEEDLTAISRWIRSTSTPRLRALRSHMP